MTCPPGGTHLAGEAVSAAGGDSDESSPEDSRQGLASRTGGAAMPSRRRRGIAFGASRRSKRRVSRLSTLVRVRRECGSRSSGVNGSPTGITVAPRRRGRPSLHNQGNRQQPQQHRLIHLWKHFALLYLLAILSFVRSTSLVVTCIVLMLALFCSIHCSVCICYSAPQDSLVWFAPLLLRLTF